MMDGLAAFLDAVVRSAAPLAFAALGELIVERSGVINIGIEGVIVFGAFASLVAAASFGPVAGVLAGAGAGVALGLVFALFVLALRAQQIIVGAAISMLGLGLSSTLHRVFLAAGHEGTRIATLGAMRIPLLSDIPVIGTALFAQPGPTYLLFLLFPLTSFVLYRTVAGVVLRATGEHPLAVAAAGHSPERVQLVAVCVGSLLAGVAGATLVVTQTGAFSDGMSAGRGFIAIAVVALGRWRPGGVVIGAALFGAASALQFLAQSFGWNVSYNLVLALPYILTLIALATLRGSSPAPAALGRTLVEEVHPFG